jgi:hypothetical protein
LTAGGQQFMDWSSAYRIFSKQKVDMSKLFKVVCASTIEELDEGSNIVVSMDDTILKKTGKKIPGTSWKRDPLGPAFQTNFIWGQRFLQISMALPEHQDREQYPLIFIIVLQLKDREKMLMNMKRKYIGQKRKKAN